MNKVPEGFVPGTSRGLREKAALGLLFVLFFIFAGDFLFRPFWFDESLTISNFVLRPTLRETYLSYPIPNNHIGYSLLLRVWLEILTPVFGIHELPFRLLSFVAGALLVFFTFSFWKRRFGSVTAFYAVLALSVSVPFSIYSTAVRGYICSALFLVFTMEAAMRFRESASKKSLASFCVSSFAALAVLPSSVVGIYAALLLAFTPGDIVDRARRNRGFLLAAIPPLFFLLFYGPIFSKLLKVMSLEEGWSSWQAACIHYYGMIAVLGAVPIFLFIVGATVGRISFCALRKAIILLLLPLPFFLLRTPPPFPRIFFPLLPLFLYTLLPGIRRFNACLRKNLDARARTAVFILISVFIAGSGVVQHIYAEFISDNLTPQFGQDDFFHPYYLDPDFDPLSTVEKIKELPADSTIFVDRMSDGPSILLYAKLAGTDWDRILFDTINRKASAPETGAFYVVAKNKDTVRKLRERFAVQKFVLIADTGHYSIYRSEGRRGE